MRKPPSPTAVKSRENNFLSRFKKIDSIFMDAPREFRARVIEKYAVYFSFCQKVAATFEKALDKPQELHDEVARVLSMFMYQAYKAHSSMYVLAVRAFVEDAATITRRLLEIAVQAI